jgi:hypothetical protein
LAAVLSAGIVAATLNLILPQEAAEDAQEEGAEEVDAESQLQAQNEK